jgi:hypothetical protein
MVAFKHDGVRSIQTGEGLQEGATRLQEWQRQNGKQDFHFENCGVSGNLGRN